MSNGGSHAARRNRERRAVLDVVRAEVQTQLVGWRIVMKRHVRAEFSFFNQVCASIRACVHIRTDSLLASIGLDGFHAVYLRILTLSTPALSLSGSLCSSWAQLTSLHKKMAERTLPMLSGRSGKDAQIWEESVR